MYQPAFFDPFPVSSVRAQKNNQMKFYGLLVFSFLFLLTACVDDDQPVGPSSETVTTEIRFTSQYDDAELTIGRETFTYADSIPLKINLTQYYISDLELLPETGSPVRLSEVDLIRFQSETDGSQAVREFEIPVGDYVGIRIGLGVKPELNSQDPNQFAADFVLNENEFWNANARYVFAKIEANADFEDDGTFDDGLSYHLGSTELYTVKTFNLNFTIDGIGDPVISFVNDVQKTLVNGSGDNFDVTAIQRVHGGNQAEASVIWDNFVEQFSILIE